MIVYKNHGYDMGRSGSIINVSTILIYENQMDKSLSLTILHNGKRINFDLPWTDLPAQGSTFAQYLDDKMNEAMEANDLQQIITIHKMLAACSGH